MTQELFNQWTLTAATLSAVAVLRTARLTFGADYALSADIRGRRLSLPAAVFHDAHAPPLSRF